MDIIEAAIQNAHIDARAKAKAAQTKSKGKDRTCKARAKAANVRDTVESPSAWRSSTDKRVRFSLTEPAKSALQQPIQSILKATPAAAQPPRPPASTGTSR